MRSGLSVGPATAVAGELERLQTLVRQFKIDCDSYKAALFEACKTRQPDAERKLQPQADKLQREASDIHELIKQLESPGRSHNPSDSAAITKIMMSLDGHSKFIYLLHTQDTVHCPNYKLDGDVISKPADVPKFLDGRKNSLQGVDPQVKRTIRRN